MDKKAKIYIAGHIGLVGSSVLNLLRRQGYGNIVFQSYERLDLRIQSKVDKFMRKQRPDYVFLFAAKVGGIAANINFPAEFLYDNIMIESNLIHASYKYKVKKVLFLGSSCTYPRECLQPMKEEYILSGKFEPTNEGYALAKSVGVKLCEYYNKEYKTNFISLISTNLYGPNDNFSLETGHVLASLILKFHRAKINQNRSVTVWGTGSPKREFLYVDDLADAGSYLMNNYDKNEIINVGTGEDISIRDLTFLIKEIIGFKGEIVFDTSKPDGMPRKLLDVTRINSLGWKAKTKLADGIRMTYAWYCQNYK